eukprot:TRINITY_DN4233_c0_g1_i1.p1 TRINITY_DN4233_c0_g1~~TRINITY_DN4233_c0_g1_i1.p1  ORF type:complete len:278 (+),score=69.17 TRINITY_DN4233_c0_g1_i1:67-900(+)
MMRSVMRRWATSVAVSNKAMLWAGLEGQSYAALAKLPSLESELPALREATTSQRTEIAKSENGAALFLSTEFKSLAEMVQFYEEMMFPVHALRDTVYNTWVDRCGINSKIVQTKNASTGDMTSWRTEYDSLDKKIQTLEAEKLAYVAKMFSTEMYNQLLNALRLAGDAPGCKQVATRVFHDMTENEITFDETTKILLNNIMFGDTVYDSSDLLFSHIEYPERGAHTYVASETMEQISDRVLGTVGERHTIETTNGADEVQRDPIFLIRPATTVGEES